MFWGELGFAFFPSEPLTAYSLFLHSGKVTILIFPFWGESFYILGGARLCFLSF